MFKINFLAYALVLIFCLALAGCGGGGATVQSSSTTIGKELSDLDETYKKGLITEDEYNTVKKDILNRYK